MYSYRDIGREAAARAARIPPGTLDALTHRNSLGGKRGSSRVYSIRDLVTLTAARALAGPGQPIAAALDTCGPLLADEPAADAIMIATEDGRTWLQAEGDGWPECDFKMIPVGTFATNIKTRLE